MRTRNTTTIALVAAALLAGGCGPQFDPASKVQSLRVFAVQKSEPYAKPGDTEHLTMLWDDPRGGASALDVTWLAKCTNPEGDLYYGCFPQLAEAFKSLSPASGAGGTGGSGGSGGLPEGVGIGNTFDFKIPSDVISSHPPPKDPTQTPYGLSYVFFTLCKGRLGPAPAGAAESFPIACYGLEDTAQKHPLGPDDFIVGYTAIYSYKTYTNTNPVIHGIRFNGKDAVDYCIDGSCESPAAPPTIDCTATPGQCIPACPGDGGSSCPEYTVKPILDKQENEENDPVAGKNLQEQMWIRYYADGGSLKSEVRLLNNATAPHWNSDYGTTFRAPKKKGPMHIWVVVQDNRGGASWVRMPIMVQ